jgi:hypothetical protein
MTEKPAWGRLIIIFFRIKRGLRMQAPLNIPMGMG